MQPFDKRLFCGFKANFDSEIEEKFTRLNPGARLSKRKTFEEKILTVTYQSSARPNTLINSF